MDGFSSFDELAETFEQTEAKPKYGSEATQKLADGDYDVEITAGIMKDTEKSGPVVTILMVVLTAGKFAGWKIEKPYFLTKKGEDGEGRVRDERRMGELKSDLSTLGFDVQNWTAANKRHFGPQLKAACEVMKGMKLKVRKKQNGEYANLYFNKRLADLDKMPAAIGPDEMKAALGGFAASGTSTGFDVPAAAPQAPASPPPPPPKTPW